MLYVEKHHVLASAGGAGWRNTGHRCCCAMSSIAEAQVHEDFTSDAAAHPGAWHLMISRPAAVQQQCSMSTAAVLQRLQRLPGVMATGWVTQHAHHDAGVGMHWLAKW